ncbi:MAG: hypothetical protein WC460_03245 [Patescibacteria group bacterium]
MKRTRGKLIIFEGINAAGKTSLIRLILKLQPDWLYCKGQGDKNTSWGRFARRHPSSPLLLMELLITNLLIVRPALKTGKIVLHDRYFFSIMAFYTAQKWYNRLLGKIFLKLLVFPDQIFLVDVNTEEALRRLRNEEPNQFHQLYLANPQMINQERGYLYQSLENYQNVINISGKDSNNLALTISEKIGGPINDS